MSESRLLKLECLFGENTGEAAVETTLRLQRTARKIADIHARVVDLSADVLDGQVMVQGTLHQQIFFVGEDGRIYHQADDVPFTVFVDVAGCTRGMTAFVQATIAKISHTLLSANDLSQRAILQFGVKVTHQQSLNVVLGDDTSGCLVKAEAIVAEATVAVPVESISTLERPAIKVRDIRISLENMTAEAAQDQILFQGTLIKSIFYISAENQEFFQEERVPFSTVADAPGARPGMNVFIVPAVSRVDRFLTSGLEVRNRIVLQARLRVTQTVEVRVAPDPAGPAVLANCVVAAASRQVLVESVLDLAVPAQKIQDIVSKVTHLTTEVIANKIIISGVLHQQIFFVGPDDVVHHQGEDVSFSTFIDLPGAQPFMTASLVPIVEHVTWTLQNPLPAAQATAADCPPGTVQVPTVPLFTRLVQKTIIQLGARVSQETAVRVKGTPAQVPALTAC